MRSWAGSGKLTKKQWEACRVSKNAERTAEKVGVCKETVQRIAAQKSWVHGWRPRTLKAADETKACEICGKQIIRRFKSGRRRSPSMWAKKRTCSNSCNVTLMWREGVYANR